MKKKYTTNPGDYLVIWITGHVAYYIAEIIKSSPLIMKVMEDGPFANLKDGDFIILDGYSGEIQRDHRECTNVFLEVIQKPVFSGLKSLGVKDGRIHRIWPAK
jgi:hypothetical protein